MIQDAVNEIRDRKAKGDTVGCCRLYRWLRTPWARFLMGDVDPEYIIRRLRDEETENSKTKGKTPRNLSVVDSSKGPGRN